MAKEVEIRCVPSVGEGKRCVVCNEFMNAGELAYYFVTLRGTKGAQSCYVHKHCMHSEKTLRIRESENLDKKVCVHCNKDNVDSVAICDNTSKVRFYFHKDCMDAVPQNWTEKERKRALKRAKQKREEERKYKAWIKEKYKEANGLWKQMQQPQQLKWLYADLEKETKDRNKWTFESDFFELSTHFALMIISITAEDNLINLLIKPVWYMNNPNPKRFKRFWWCRKLHQKNNKWNDDQLAKVICEQIFDSENIMNALTCPNTIIRKMAKWYAKGREKCLA